MAPSPRTGYVIGAVAVAGLLLPPPITALLIVAVLAGAVVDAASVRRVPELVRRVAPVLARGVESRLVCEAVEPGRGRMRIRQPVPWDLALTPSESDDRLDASLVPRRRGRHTLPAMAVRRDGPLGLGRWYHRAGEAAEVLVYPDLPAARRLALAVRQGRFRDPGRMTRGPLGLGTDFESIRDYNSDDDIRQVNWRATARLGRPMSNQYRIEQDRDIVCVVDCGRLMGAPLAGSLTRLDAAIDATAAVALVADEVGDRCGAVAFDAAVRRSVSPRRSGGDAVVRAVFDLEPISVDSDYELAFRTMGGAKRAMVLVFTDLLEEAAARPLIEAVPLLARRHAVVIATAADPDFERLVSTPPERVSDVYRAAAALDVLDAQERVAGRLRRAGADVIEAPPARLGAACIGAYLRAKSLARL